MIVGILITLSRPLSHPPEYPPCAPDSHSRKCHTHYLAMYYTDMGTWLTHEYGHEFTRMAVFLLVLSRTLCMSQLGPPRLSGSRRSLNRRLYKTLPSSRGVVPIPLNQQPPLLIQPLLYIAACRSSLRLSPGRLLPSRSSPLTLSTMSRPRSKTRKASLPTSNVSSSLESNSRMVAR